MTITREDLELAALVAGLRHVNYDGLDYDGRDGLVLVDGIGRHLDDWRPHLDDGDAARLAVRLNMTVAVWEGSSDDGPYIEAETDEWAVRCGHDGSEPDKMRAWREAVTMCAAAVGRRMKGVV